MPIFFQQPINDTTRLGIWKIEETEEFFKRNVPLHRDVTHPHKRLQHLAGRFLLPYLFPDFPPELIQIADTRKPFLPDEQFHFSISHCGDYAAAIVSKNNRVGIDIEIPTPKVETIIHKFLSQQEQQLFHASRIIVHQPTFTTLLWSAKEAIFKWNGSREVDFIEHIHLKKQHDADATIECLFTRLNETLTVHYHLFDRLVLAWVMS